MKPETVKQFAKRIRGSVKRCGAPGLEEELTDYADRVEMARAVKIADTLGLSMDVCLGRPVRREFVKVSPFVVEHLERIRSDMPFLGDTLDEISDYVFKKFIGESWGIRRPEKDTP